MVPYLCSSPSARRSRHQRLFGPGYALSPRPRPNALTGGWTSGTGTTWSCPTPGSPTPCCPTPVAFGPPPCGSTLACCGRTQRRPTSPVVRSLGLYGRQWSPSATRLHDSSATTCARRRHPVRGNGTGAQPLGGGRRGAPPRTARSVVRGLHAFPARCASPLLRIAPLRQRIGWRRPRRRRCRPPLRQGEQSTELIVIKALLGHAHIGVTATVCAHVPPPPTPGYRPPRTHTWRPGRGRRSADLCSTCPLALPSTTAVKHQGRVVRRWMGLST